MRKLLFSIVGGLVIGGILSYWLLDYQDQSYEILNYFGSDKTVKEWDWMTISSGGFLILGASVFCFIVGTIVEKRSL